MAYKKLHDSFWTDPELEDWKPEQRYLYMYLFSCPFVNQIGLYELGMRDARNQTGLSEAKMKNILQFLVDRDKIVMSDTTKEIVVRNLYKHNFSKSPSVKTHTDGLLNLILMP